MPDFSVPHRRLSDDQGNRVAVIDIGSNSVRLVIYDHLDRTPMVLFNEKSMCALGRGLAGSGRLNPEGKELALRTLDRFAHLLRRLNVSQVFAVATAALREAEDGPDFIEALNQSTGLPVEVIPGDEEARLSALGVISGMPEADGLVGDLGGGSLELVRIRERQHSQRTSLPLGPFKFPDKIKKRDEAIEHIRAQFAEHEWLQEIRGRHLFAVGGAWRTLARLHMEQTRHPLHIIHAYEIPLDEAISFCDLISKQSRGSLEKTGSVPNRRLDTLPHAALLMQVLLEQTRPRSVQFSANGLREGLLFDRLSPAMQIQDPLLYACRTIDAHNSRFNGSAGLLRFTARLFADESSAETRLRRAACLLSDFCWVEHPDYRAEHAFLRVLRSTITGINHPERIMLATILYRRYGGKAANQDNQLIEVLDEGQRQRAEQLGAALRLGHTLAGGAEDVLDHLTLEPVGGRLVLQVPADLADLVTDGVERRLASVAKAMAIEPAIEIDRNRAA